MRTSHLFRHCSPYITSAAPNVSLLMRYLHTDPKYDMHSLTGSMHPLPKAENYLCRYSQRGILIDKSKRTIGMVREPQIHVTGDRNQGFNCQALNKDHPHLLKRSNRHSSNYTHIEQMNTNKEAMENIN